MIRDPMQALEAWEALESGQRPSLASAVAERGRRLELRDLTSERLWMLLVQRESVGLRDHRELLQRVPQEIRKRIGPRQRTSLEP